MRKGTARSLPAMSLRKEATRLSKPLPPLQASSSHQTLIICRSHASPPPSSGVAQDREGVLPPGRHRCRPFHLSLLSHISA